MKTKISLKQAGKVWFSAGCLAILCSTVVYAMPNIAYTGNYKDPVLGQCQDTGGYEDYQKCLSQIEQKYLQQNTAIAQRNGDELCISAEQATALCFTDNPVEGEAVERYRYIGQLNQLPVAVVYSSHWEWSTYHLISTKTGAIVLELNDGPTEFAVSSDGKYIVASSKDLDEVYNPNALWIYQVEEDQSWTQVWELVQQDEIVADLVWDSDTQFKGTRYAYVDKDGESALQSAGKVTVTYDGIKWSASFQ